MKKFALMATLLLTACSHSITTSPPNGTPLPVAVLTGPIVCTVANTVCVGHSGGTAPLYGFSIPDDFNFGGISCGNGINNLYWNTSDDSVWLDPGDKTETKLIIGGKILLTSNATYTANAWHWIGVGGNPFGESGNVPCVIQ